MLADVVQTLDGQPDRVVLVGHSLGGLLALRAAVARPDRVVALILEDPARPDGSRTPDPRFVAETEQFLDSMSDSAGQVRRMTRETRWSRAEIEAWAECKPLVDRTFVHQGLYLGDGAWEQPFNALRVPTLLLVPPASPMAPRRDALRNDLVRTVVVPGAGHCVRRDQPDLYHQALDAFLAEITRARLDVGPRRRSRSRELVSCGWHPGRTAHTFRGDPEEGCGGNPVEIARPVR